MKHSCEHFLLGVIGGRYRLLKSEGLDKIVSRDSMEFLQQLGSKKIVVTATPLCKDRLYAVSYLRPDKDEFGRPAMWNHTIIIQCDQMFESLKDKINDKLFIKEANSVLTSQPLTPVSFET